MPNNQKQITNNQHIVPAFYLRQFTMNGELQVLDLEHQAITKPKRPKSVCWEKHFYAQDTGTLDPISPAIEEWLSIVESNLANKYDPICDAILGYTKLDDEQLLTLSALISVLWLRNGAIRELTNRMTEKIVKDVSAIMAQDPNFDEQTKTMFAGQGEEISEEGLTGLKNMLISKEYTVKPCNLGHIRLLMKQNMEFASIFFAKKWRFYIADGNSRFITSDTPVIETWPNRSLYGASIWERTQYLALRPNLLLELSDPLLPGKRVKRLRISKDKVTALNLMRSGLSQQFCYGAFTDELRNVLDHTSAQFRERRAQTHHN